MLNWLSPAYGTCTTGDFQTKSPGANERPVYHASAQIIVICPQFFELAAPTCWISCRKKNRQADRPMWSFCPSVLMESSPHRRCGPDIQLRLTLPCLVNWSVWSFLALRLFIRHHYCLYCRVCIVRELRNSIIISLQYYVLVSTINTIIALIRMGSPTSLCVVINVVVEGQHQV